MRKLIISLSAKKVNSKQLNKAKKIVDAANKQQNRELMLSYKDSEKTLTILRKNKDKEVNSITNQISQLQNVLNKTIQQHDNKINKAIASRDKAAARAGIITTAKADKTTKTVVTKKEQPKTEVKSKSSKLVKQPSRKTNKE